MGGGGGRYLFASAVGAFAAASWRCWCTVDFFKTPKNQHATQSRKPDQQAGPVHPRIARDGDCPEIPIVAAIFRNSPMKKFARPYECAPGGLFTMDRRMGNA